MTNTILISATVNHELRQLPVRSNQTVLELLREDLRLRGTVEGCSVGVCGSCTVLVDGKPISSCLMLATNLDGKNLLTIEGLSKDGALDPVQAAFLEQQAFQCGFCTRGMIMAVEGLLLEKPEPTDEETRDYLSGNICRCGTYAEVFEAVRSVVRLRAGE